MYSMKEVWSMWRIEVGLFSLEATLNLSVMVASIEQKSSLKMVY